MSFGKMVTEVILPLFMDVHIFLEKGSVTVIRFLEAQCPLPQA
jgi:hypothetical protein